MKKILLTFVTLTWKYRIRLFISAFLISGGLLLVSFLPFSKESPAPVPSRPVMCASTLSKEVLRNLDTTRQIAPLLKGLGDHTMTVTSSSEEAKKFFNQGLTLYYGFNHLEAFRSFKEAARLDPNFALSYWGQAMCLGPNINAPMDPSDGKTVYAAVVKAQSLKGHVSAKEKMLIDAVAKRYTEEAPADRTHLDQAYADEMKKAAEKFPADADVLSLYAEAMMDQHPWDYWQKDGTPKTWTPDILTTIEKAFALNAEHPGAHHLYIHAYEASSTPGRATRSADLLGKLVPAAGHLVHMPSHIYIRTGRYKDGVAVNQKAIKMDEEYLTQCKAGGFYPLILYPHNIHFLWACATLDGQSAQAVKAADLLAAKQDLELMVQPAWNYLQQFYATPYFVRVRFGRWDEILLMEKPDDRLSYANGMYRYARAIAFSRKNNSARATAELQELKKITWAPSLDSGNMLGLNSIKHVLRIAEKVTEGELAAASKNYEQAIASLKEAVRLEDELLYQEPYDWHHPARQVLGDILLEAGDAAQAEKYFREDLQMFAGNGWSLTGLSTALKRQGKTKEAEQTDKELKKSFARADIQLKTARF
jgi:tetratricopeptide (TPR) repeat protein